MHSALPCVLHMLCLTGVRCHPICCCRQKQLEAVYEDASVAVPKPEHWGGFLVRPTAMEFWQGRPSRLHDRLRYSRTSTDSNEWKLERLYP